MRAWILPVLTGFMLLAACDGSSTTSGNTGGGGAGGETSTTTDGGGGSTTTDTGMTTTDTGMTTTTMATDLCETAGSTPVSFANDVQPIFSQSCGNACHLKDSSPSAGLSLKAGEAYAELVGVDAAQACNGQKRVAPGSAADSYLVNKITATDLCPNTKKMPPSSTLPDATKQKIIDWICQGAENN